MSASKIPALFTPFSLRGLTVKNRIAMGPMCTYTAKDGIANAWHHTHYNTRAAGGAGMLVIEATGVVPEGRISPGCLGMWNNDQAKALQPMVEYAHSQGAKIGIQLGHSGRKGSCAGMPQGGMPLLTSRKDQDAWDVVAPSAIPFNADSATPKELTKNDIKALVQSFAEAAERAVKLGKMDFLEMHFAHGYLLHEFASPITNKRTDDYGGSFENRTRLHREIVQAVRKVMPAEMPLLARLSCEDWLEGGWTLQESVQLAKDLKTLGTDLIDCSGGAIAAHEIPKGYITPMYMVTSAEAIKKQAGIATAAVGGIKTAQDANAIIESGRADLTMIASTHLYEPFFALRAASALGIEQQTLESMWPKQYQWPIRYLRVKI